VIHEESKIWKAQRIFLEANHLCPEEIPQLLEEALETSIKHFLDSANRFLCVISSHHIAHKGYTVAHWVDALQYKLESHRFDSVSNTNEYQGYLLGVKAANAQG
jgi:hypothetical protein